MGNDTDEKSTRTEVRELNYKQLYEQHFERIFVFISGRLDDRETALDLTQEVFYQLMKTNPSFSSIKGEIVSYLYGIAKIIVSHYYDGHKELTVDDEDYFKQIPREFKVPQIRSRTLSRCIKKLKTIDQKIFYGYFYMGQNHREIAEELNMTHGQVRQRFRRALRKLQNCLMKNFL